MQRTRQVTKDEGHYLPESDSTDHRQGRWLYHPSEPATDQHQSLPAVMSSSALYCQLTPLSALQYVRDRQTDT